MTDLYDLLLAQKLSGGGGGGGGGGKNIQVAIAAAGISSPNATQLTGVTLTVQKTGLYTCAWFAVRSTKNSGTQATQLYINGKAYGTESTDYDNPLYSVGHLVVLNSVQLNEGDVIRVYGRSSNSSYGALAGNLTIVEE